MGNKLEELELQRTVLDAQIHDERMRLLKDQGKVFDTVLAFLQHSFPNHEVIQQDNKYYLDEIIPEKEIYVSKGKKALHDILIMTHQMVTIMQSKKPDDTEANLAVEKSLRKLQERTGTNHTIFAPPFYKCSTCGIVPGSPESRYENTIGEMPLSGHSGSNLHCTICGAYMGEDRDSIHVYS
ncbi:hypothetical protein HN858_03625 [Candidatus Falkowbacteria bacterium]|jgi:hypothetical protein|nr:hypothetical protein [Candidatus Falkowbacteria bacterium]MBT5503688.1 hypothetical protein [Candidatus Falkowbacteria bacterium]MBT6573832.1 hypothetical protein [Candidatus Falkowbacteria bacterium]MBT7348740.1 hypothetical protein [Candidatus Falkowbacteria bacterium]MBT7500530.1 hypothetical protein [Candidatus Falkowbacteria bacterium]